MTLETVVAVFTAGIASHVAFFHRGEHHMHGPRYLKIFFGLYALAIAIDTNFNGEPLIQAFANVSSLASCYLAGLYASLLAYRLFITPLNAFPGPLLARISNFWFSSQLGKKDAYKKVTELHDKYGDIVRVGSNDLSIIHPNAVNAIYGPGSTCQKSEWYDQSRPLISLQTTRDRAVHNRRRRIWSTAFSDKALRGYEERIKVYQDQLIAQIEKSGDNGIDMTKWFNLFSFDVMGDLAFGKPFGMLLSSEAHWAIKLLVEGMEVVAYMFPTWFFRTAVSLPKLMDDWLRFIDYCSQKLDERMNVRNITRASCQHADISQMTVTTPDMMSSLLEPHKDMKPTADELNMLRGDSQLIVVAGRSVDSASSKQYFSRNPTPLTCFCSDTTASTFASILYELVRNPEHISKVREEITPNLTSTGDVLDQKIQHLNHLNGVINETLRLHPPVPTALPRCTPPEGLEIGDKHIPGNTTVWCPQYTIGKSSSHLTLHWGHPT